MSDSKPAETKPMPRWLAASGVTLIAALVVLIVLDTGIGAPPPRPEIPWPDGEPWDGARAQLFTNQAVPTEIECDGSIDTLASGSGEFDQITGWLFSPEAANAPTTAHVLNGGQIMIGFAVLGTARPDVARVKGPGGENSGFTAVLQSPAIATVRLQGTFADGRSCFVDAKVPPPN